MFEFLKRLWSGRRAPAPVEPAADAELDLKGIVWKTPHGAGIDMDSFSAQSREKLYQELAEQNERPIFEGEVRHGYAKASAGGTATCPRCGAPTRQYCAHFIYATDSATRVMMAPAGFFCSRCPTVIIDEEIIVAGVKSGFKYQGVIGIDFLGKKEPALFETWNGRKPIYIFDEDKRCHGLGFADLPIWHSGGPQPALRPEKRSSDAGWPTGPEGATGENQRPRTTR